ncbi:hypothetical protein ACFVU2_05210 [Leifsonia sp. NPDC058194]|uniref:hypothetical protein n=1 Tax=Leifsonia sp. NPDC058194 TaxID=3346374 RepID=UPI0036DD38B4
MSTPAEPADEPRENLEGSYTEVDGEAPHERTVHGQYTETEDNPGPETDVEGTYTDVEEAADAPQGEYTDTDEP